MSNVVPIDLFLQKLKTVFDNSPEGMVITDMTKDDQPIIYTNDTFLKMTGYSRQETVGRNCRFMQGNDREQIGVGQIRAAIKADESCRVTLRNYRKDDTLFYNRLSLFPIRGQENKTKFYVGIQDDISDLIMSKEEISELKRLNEFKNQMMGMAAHDLRTPLMVIQNFADFLIDDHKEQSFFTEEQYMMVTEVKETSNYMIKIIEDLLDISSFESGTTKLDKDVIDLVNLIEQVVFLSRSYARKKNIVITTQLPDSSVNKVLDGRKFRQVLDNLLSNAIKYSNPDTKIEVKIEYSDKAEGVTIYVHDHGQGIPEDEIERLFEPYSNISVESTAGEKSTGLGLAIVKKIIEAHGAKIEVESEVGKGSTFIIKLP